ncbi:MAG: NAD(P)/FAD-dependent oxidoreductase [Butyribacter sp.]|nr:NAD(P)/FAD-dependent oxidoreductase [bacterium]MDY3854738.1 NAD(P)/FAD-dependent oxidoreductase [Butyribacter sp.]
MRSIEVLVIGGGASGMMAAIEAKRQGAKVLLLEKKPRLGKKLLATGNGKCNFTNQLQEKNCYRSEQKEFPWKVVEAFGCQQTVDWFHKIGILAKDKGGYVYPASEQATSVVHALEREIQRLKIEVHTEEWVEEIKPHTGKGNSGMAGYNVSTQKDSYLAKKVILSTGGKAAPVHGSTGDGYVLAESLGHHLVFPVPALTSLILEENVKAWSGVRIQGKVSLLDEKEQLLCEDTGEIQMVSYGISGIPVFQISRYAAREIANGKKVYLLLDCMPDKDKEWIYQELQYQKEQNEKQSAGDLLEGIFPDKLIGVLLKKSDISIKESVSNLTDRQIWHLVHQIKKLQFQVKEVSDFEKAQVTAGGISAKEIETDTMESKICKGLYLTGEVVDVDGICGGYNLQWAWASGYTAGRASAAAIKKERNVCK